MILGNKILIGGKDNNFDYSSSAIMYTLRRPKMSTLWSFAVLNIRRTSDNATANVFFDGSLVGNTITLSSFISTTSNTTPSTTTLATWIGSDDAYVINWYLIDSSNYISAPKSLAQLNTAKQPKFITAGAIITKGGKPAIDFLSDTRTMGRSDGGSHPLLSSAPFTMITVSNLRVLNTSGTIWSNSDVSTYLNDSRIHQTNDNNTGKYHSFLRNTLAVNHVLYLLAQQNTVSQKLLSTVLESGGNLKAYYNDIIQNTLSVSGSWVNSVFRLGVQRNDVSPHDGTIQEIIGYNSDETPNLIDLHTDINNYYSIY